MNDYGEAFSWPARDPAAVRKLLVAGLLALIPVVGQLFLVGWTLSTLDNLRAERYELAAPELAQIARGLRLCLLLLAGGLLVAALVAAASLGALRAPAALGLSGLVICLVVLLFAFMQPPLWLESDLAAAARRPLETLVAAVLMWAGWLIAGLGVVFCVVGAIVTLPFGAAVVAGVLRAYELQLNQPSAAPV